MVTVADQAVRPPVSEVSELLWSYVGTLSGNLPRRSDTMLKTGDGILIFRHSAGHTLVQCTSIPGAKSHDIPTSSSCHVLWVLVAIFVEDK